MENLNIKREDMIDLHISTDKIIQMRYISKYYKVEFKDIHFVDDNLDHLVRVQKLSVNVYLASWGYCTEEQKIIAEKSKDIILLTEKNLYLVLNSFLKPAWLTTILEIIYKNITTLLLLIFGALMMLLIPTEKNILNVNCLFITKPISPPH